MDLLKVLINPLKSKSTCFLCFKQNEQTTCVSQKMFVFTEFRTFDLALTDIMEYLFPNHDVLFDQVCMDCSTFLVTAFTILHKHNTQKGIICNLTNFLSNKIDCFKEVVSDSKFYVMLNLPIFGKTSDTDLEDIDCKIDRNDEKKLTEYAQHIHRYEYCKKCEMKFMSKNILSQHDKIAHKNISKAIICEFCGKDCKKPGSLKIHLNCHKEKSCPYCHKTLKTHCYYKVHVKNHEVIEKRPLRRSQYTCNVCPYKSLNKNSLDAHNNKVHLKTRPFICEICDKGFYKKSNLTEHAIIHRNVKNLTCEQCGDNFVTKKTLSEHLRLHSGEKPFQCEICNLSFITSGRKSDHFKRKHMEKTLCCFVCNKMFSLKKDLNAHVKKAHSQNKNKKEISLIESKNLFRNYVDGKLQKVWL